MKLERKVIFVMLVMDGTYEVIVIKPPRHCHVILQGKHSINTCALRVASNLKLNMWSLNIRTATYYSIAVNYFDSRLLFSIIPWSLTLDF